MSRNVTVLLALIVVTSLAVSAVSPDDATSTATDWPPMQITYQTTFNLQPGSTLQNRRVTELTYLSRDDWHDEVVEATFNAGSPGATRVFHDGVFTQNFPEAGRPIVEEVEPGHRPIPECWLHPGTYEYVSARGMHVAVQDGSHVIYQTMMVKPCEGILPEDRPPPCDGPGADVAVQTFTYRTDLTAIPVPVEYSNRIGDVITEESVVQEIVLLGGDR